MSICTNDVCEPDSGGCIYILGYVIDDSRLYPESSVTWNLHFLNIYDDGQAFTEAEYQSWLIEILHIIILPIIIYSVTIFLPNIVTGP